MKGMAIFATCCIVLILILGVGGVMWEEMMDKRELTLLRAETAQAEANAHELEAQALADQAAADLQRAQGEAYLKASEGDAIKAPALAAARAVDGNTAIVGAMGKTNTLYDRLLPLGGLLFMIVLVFFGIALGVGGAVGFYFYREWKKKQGLKLVVPVADTALDIG